jgi:hypothetical protein
MPKLTQLEELDIAIRMAAAEAVSEASNIELAGEFYQSHRELIEPFLKQWALDKLANLIGKHRLETKRASDSQLVFEGMLGFKHLPRRIEVKPGKSVPRAAAKIGAFRKLARQKSPAQLAARTIVELMIPYAKKNSNVTYGEVLRKEAEKKAKRDGLTLPLFSEQEAPNR